MGVHASERVLDRTTLDLLPTALYRKRKNIPEEKVAQISGKIWRLRGIYTVIDRNRK